MAYKVKKDPIDKIPKAHRACQLFKIFFRHAPICIHILIIFVFYAFTAPFVNPLTMYLCMKIKINTTGEIAMIPNAIVEFHSV